MKNLSEFTNLYSLSKTLRFELKPIGKTLEHIQAKGLLTQDSQRADDYLEVKKIVDEYHKAFIERVLNGLQLDFTSFQELYNKKDKEEKEIDEFKKLKETLRKQIAEKFTKHADYNKVSKEGEGIAAVIAYLQENSEKRILVEKFNRFTTYFTGFYENRKNMYTSDEKTTAIAYRIVHENLPKFLDNLRVFEKVKEQIDFDFASLEEGLEAVLQGETLAEYFTLSNFNNCLTQNGIDKYNTVLGGIAEEEGQRRIQGLNEYINLYRQNKQFKPKDLPNLKPLYKQILSDIESVSFLLESFENDTQLLKNIKKFYQNEATAIFELQTLLDKLNEYNTEQIFVRNGMHLTSISQQLFGDWDMIYRALGKKFE